MDFATLVVIHQTANTMEVTVNNNILNFLAITSASPQQPPPRLVYGGNGILTTRHVYGVFQLSFCVVVVERAVFVATFNFFIPLISAVKHFFLHLHSHACHRNIVQALAMCKLAS